MRRLFLVRHAKASSKDLAIADAERPLNKRGERDAPAMGARLAGRKVRPQVVIASDARRASMTARLLAEAMGFAAEQIRLDPRLYAADAGDLLAIVRGFEPGWASVMLVGHNPAITDLVNALTDEIIENVPTCGVAEIVFDGDDWQKIGVGDGRLVAFDYPRGAD